MYNLTYILIVSTIIVMLVVISYLAIYWKRKFTDASYNCSASDSENKRQKDIMHSIYAGMPVGIFCIDKDGIVTYLNDIGALFYGINNIEKFVDSRFNIFQDKNTSDRTKDDIRNGIATHFMVKLHDDENDIIKINYNNTRFLDCRTKPIYDTSNNLCNTIIIVNDISSDKIAEQELKDRCSMIQLAAKASGIYIYYYEVSEDLYYSLHNNRFVQTNFTRCTILDRIHIDDRKPYLDFFNNAKIGVTPSDTQTFRIHSFIDGEYKFYEFSIYAIIDEDKKVKRLIQTLKNVNEIRKKNAELEEYKARTTLVTINSHMTQWEYNVSNNSFIFDNNNILPQFKGTVLSEELCNIVHPDDRNSFMDVLDLMKSQSYQTITFDTRVSANSFSDLVYLHSTCVPLLDTDGTVYKYIGMITDNTDWQTLTTKLNDSIEQNEIILNNIQSGIAFITTDFEVIWENTTRIFSDNPTFSRFSKGTVCFRDIRGKSTPCDGCTIAKGFITKETESFCHHIGDKLFNITSTPIFNRDGTIRGSVIKIDNMTESV